MNKNQCGKVMGKCGKQGVRPRAAAGKSAGPAFSGSGVIIELS